MAEARRIEIQPNGPYRVFGGIPLKEMAPVHTFNGEPVDWHNLKQFELPSETYDLCRCGRSRTKPFCDNSHERRPFDGTETASHDLYRERAQSWEHDGELLMDDGPLCVSAGFCRTVTRDVWTTFEKAEDPARRAEMQQMVWNCPSGRLALVAADGFPNEPPIEAEIAVIPGGPLWIRGGVPIYGSDGYLWEPRNRVTVCRCGASGNKPFCDRSHEQLKFDPR